MQHRLIRVDTTVNSKTNPRSLGQQSLPALQLKCGSLTRSFPGQVCSFRRQHHTRKQSALLVSVSEQEHLTCRFEKSCQSGGPPSSGDMQRCSPIIGGTVHVGITLNSPTKKELAEGSLLRLSTSIFPSHLRLRHSPHCYTVLALSLKKSPVRALGWSRGCRKCRADY